MAKKKRSRRSSHRPKIMGYALRLAGSKSPGHKRFRLKRTALKAARRMSKRTGRSVSVVKAGRRSSRRRSSRRRASRRRSSLTTNRRRRSRRNSRRRSSRRRR
jgi:hypothetical protein